MVEVSATEFRRRALKLLEHVQHSGEPVQITKRGKPVAQLVPIEPLQVKRVFGQFRGEATITGDIVGPILTPDEWGELA